MSHELKSKIKNHLLISHSYIRKEMKKIMKIRVKKLDAEAKLPKYQHGSGEDAGDGSLFY